jgi:regulator of ribonuclease activity A
MDDATAATADLADRHPETCRSCDLQLIQYGGRRRFHGVVSTVSCFEDNVLVRAKLAEPGQGRVLVVDGGGSLHVALLGDAMAGLALENGWAGIVVHGAVRDVAQLRSLDVGIKALGSNPHKSGKNGTGSCDVPVTFGGVTFRPGATLVSDEDGIVTLDPAPSG